MVCKNKNFLVHYNPGAGRLELLSPGPGSDFFANFTPIPNTITTQRTSLASLPSTRPHGVSRHAQAGGGRPKGAEGVEWRYPTIAKARRNEGSSERSRAKYHDRSDPRRPWEGFGIGSRAVHGGFQNVAAGTGNLNGWASVSLAGNPASPTPDLNPSHLFIYTMTTVPKTARMTLHFVYGSLMSPEVVKELLGRVPPQIPGTLLGYTRWRVPDQGASTRKKVEKSRGVLVLILVNMTHFDEKCMLWCISTAFEIKWRDGMPEEARPSILEAQ